MTLPTPSTEIRPDLVLLAGRVRTGLGSAADAAETDGTGRETLPFDAVAVRGRHIVAVARRADVDGWNTSAAEIIDLGESTITAGFVDAHVHPLSGAESRHNALMLHDCETTTEVAERIAAFAAERGPEEWIRGFGLSFDMFVGHEITNEPFARAFGGRPGYLLLFDGHSIIASPRALERAGIDGTRDFGNNSSIEVYADGTPTGYLIESDAESLVTDLYPRMPVEARVTAVQNKLAEFAASGYTSLHQMNMEEGDLDVLRALEESGELPVRVRVSRCGGRAIPGPRHCAA